MIFPRKTYFSCSPIHILQNDTSTCNICLLLIVLVQLGSTEKKLGGNLNTMVSLTNIIERHWGLRCVGGKGSQEQKALPTLEELTRLTG